METEITLRVLSYGLVVLLAITLLVLSLISIRKENRRGEPIGGMIWFSLAMIGFCAVIVLLAGYAQKAKSLEKDSPRVSAVAVEMNMKVTEVTIHPAIDIIEATRLARKKVNIA